jgi:urease accessory protein
VIESTGVVGNVHRDPGLTERYARMLREERVERIVVSRFESNRARLLKVSDRGSEVALILPTGSSLHDGDVVSLRDDLMVVVTREPERVAVLRLRETGEPLEMVEMAFRVGHSLGNLHRPIAVEHLEVRLPIQAESEMEMLRKLFSDLSDHLEIFPATMIFDPELGEEDHVHADSS